VLCFRLHFTKDSTTTNTAAATIRQIVSVVFERVVLEDGRPAAGWWLEHLSSVDYNSNYDTSTAEPVKREQCPFLHESSGRWRKGVVVECIYEPYVFSHSSSAECNHCSPPSRSDCGQLLIICDIVWRVQQEHILVAARPHFFRQDAQWPCLVQKWFTSAE